MRFVVAGVVAVIIAGLLHLSLDSGVFAPRAERLVSLPLLGLGAIFGGSAWAASVSGQTNRSRLMAGLAIGVGGYAVFRLLAW